MKALARQTLYEILEVPSDAPPDEIERACERAAALYGPDSLATYTLVPSEDASLLTARIEEARKVLLDAASRAAYDASLGGGPAEPGPGLATAGTGEPAAAPGVEPAAGVEIAPAAPSGGAPAARPVLVLSTAVSPAGSGSHAAPIPLRREIPVASPERDVVVPEGTAWTGDVLRKVREARGITVDQISERTKVVRHHVENIEADRFGLLPAPVYLRGILVAIARELRLDGQKVARSYLERIQAAAPPAPPPPSRSR